MTRDTASLLASVFRFALIAGLAGCGGDDDAAADASTGADAAPGADGATDRAIDFPANRSGWIHLVEGYTGFDGVSAAVRDRVDVPVAELIASEGDCEVWVHPADPAQCDPPCEGGYCVAEDRCEPYPQLTPAGVITTTGVAGDLRFLPVEYGYQADPEVPPEDLFSDDGRDHGDRAGRHRRRVRPRGRRRGPRSTPSSTSNSISPWSSRTGVDEVFEWTPESSGEIQLALLTGHHGAPWYSLLVCETADDGELVVPGSLISQFPRDESGFEQHSSWIARYPARPRRRSRSSCGSPAGSSFRRSSIGRDGHPRRKRVGPPATRAVASSNCQGTA